jgi:agmatinase
MTSIPSTRTPGSFMGLPFATTAAGSRLAVLGIPFDCGTHQTRIGSRLGPSAIREQSSLVRRFRPEQEGFDPIATLSAVDCGDVVLVSSQIEEAFDHIEAAVAAIADTGAITLTFGGDGAVTLPQLRALSRRHSGLVVLHVDAHTDAYPAEGPLPYNTATTFTHAAKEGLIDVASSVHLGARGTTYAGGVFSHTRGLGYEVWPYNVTMARGVIEVLGELHRKLEGRPVYLCWDMDFFDPSCAPGVCTPAWGGASAREGLALLQGLAGLNFVGFDINTVSPPHDVGGMTAFLAATVGLECLFLACAALGLAPPVEGFDV